MRSTLTQWSLAFGAGLVVGLNSAAIAFGPEFTYATMSDGVKIALAVSYPPSFDPDEAITKWPALFVMDGYGGGADPVGTSGYGDDYVIVHASIRGTGCSGGTFDLFDRRHAEDGKEIIDVWLPSQPWFDPSGGRVGIIGHSFGGLTGFHVASTQPQHLGAIAISGLIDDLYRGIVYVGGIANPGFPLLWTLFFRPGLELAGNYDRYVSETTAPDPTCAANIATRLPPRPPLEDPVVRGVTTFEDGPWWQYRSLASYVKSIDRPIHITHQYQDEQTGPRGGPALWEKIPSGVPKRVVLTNGIHATTAIAHGDRLQWLDCYVRDVCVGDVTDATRRVRAHFETTGTWAGTLLGGATATANPPLVEGDFPLPSTAWERYYLRAGNVLSTTAPPPSEAGDSYLALPEGRQLHATHALGLSPSLGVRQLDEAVYGPIASSGGPDEVSYVLDFGAPTAIAGPIAATLWMQSTAPDTDVFVQLIDVDADGNHSYLQRGQLRATHRALDPLRSDRVASGPHAGEIYRPHHPHTDTLLQLLDPTQAHQLVIEIFPVGHVFRAGHRLAVKIHSPPVADSFYAYASGRSPALNTILHDEDHPSSILLPVLAALPPIGSAPACGSQVGVRCVKPLAP